MKLKDINTRSDFGMDQDALKDANKELSKRVVELQRLLMADSSRSLLVILQGVDASGKDGVLKDVFYKINPAGCNVHSFKKPTQQELSQDFLWRVHQVCPPKGMIQIFNRSHYEDILVPTVEGFLSKEQIEQRYHAINNFEEMLEANGTKILKFYLHISKDRQKQRLLDRINIREKHWKHNDGDWEVRQKWDEYMAVYENIFERCNRIPWHIIPADDNREKCHSIAKLVVTALEKMNLSYPDLKSTKFTPDYQTS